MIFISFLKDNLKPAVLYAFIYFSFLLMFILCSLPLEIYLYTVLFSGFVLLLAALYSFFKYKEKIELLESIKNSITVTTKDIPLPKNRAENAYQELISILHSEIYDLKRQTGIRITNMTDYYTMWVHQIKTPISAMKLIMQSGSDAENAELSAQLLKIEDYVEMVLAYIRMDSDSTDYIIKEYNLEDTVKQAVRKYAQLFIRKKIKVEMNGLDTTVISDEKWLSFVVGQILSNAVKYSDKGKVSIYLKPPKTLVIEDNGSGIAKDDLPRIFEKGFTGYNGRADKSATGIGLYLSKQILNRLGHNITVQSEIGKGTKFMIDLSRRDIMAE